MSTFKLNPVSNQMETTFNGKLVSIGENSLQNTNGIKFRVCSVELPNGKVRSARVYEKNLSYGMSVGTSYLCTASMYKDTKGIAQVDVKVSHLTGAERASLEDFGFQNIGNEGVETLQKDLAAQAM